MSLFVLFEGHARTIVDLDKKRLLFRLKRPQMRQLLTEFLYCHEWKIYILILN